jgi:PAS domain S-box-containing protein
VIERAIAGGTRRGSTPSARILVVEDDADLAAIVRRTLENRGYLTEWAADARELESAIDGFRPDLLVLDNHLPGRTGLAALTQLRVAGRDVAAVVLTAHAELRDTVHFVRAGAEDVLAKPFQPAALLAAVGRALERRALSLRARQFRERLEAERLSAARCATLVTIARDLIWRLDDAGRLAEANPASCELLGTLADRLVGRPVAELLTEASRGTLARALAAGTGEEVEVDLQVGSDTVPLALRAHAILDAEGRVVGHWVVGHDLRRQRRLSRELAAAEKRAGIVRLIGGLSHELSGALGSIVGQAALALRTAILAPVRDALKDIEAAALRSTELLCSLRAVAWTEAPRVAVPPEEVTRLAVATRAPLFAQNGVALDVRLAPALPPVRGRSTDLQRALEEILDNARHACTGWPGTRRVTLTLQPAADGGVEWECRDTGEGIPAGDLPRVFDPFFTRKGALGGRVFDGKVHGTGLGLTIVQAIVEAHRGTIAVGSEPSQGTVVRLRLPPVGATAPAAGPPRATCAADGRA